MNQLLEAYEAMYGNLGKVAAYIAENGAEAFIKGGYKAER